MSVARGARKTTHADSSRAEMGTEIDDSDTSAAGFRLAGIHRGKPGLAVDVERARTPRERAIRVTALAVRPESSCAYLPRGEVIAQAVRASVGISRVDSPTVGRLARFEAVAAVRLQSFAF